MAADHLKFAGEALVRVRGLSKQYAQRHGFMRERFFISALDGVGLAIAAGQTLAVVGESGSGKSTLARCLALLERPTDGEIWFDGENLLGLQGDALRAVRAKVQLIFQDPAAALNPRLTALEVVEEPLLIQDRGRKSERRERALALMELVGLSPKWSERRPLEFSGGQRQRLVIARALALEPKFLILDEALSALDPPIQAQLINLLLALQRERHIAYLYITHDLSIVGHLADEVVILQQGKIVERGETSELFLHPQHPHTRALLASVPVLDGAVAAPFVG